MPKKTCLFAVLLSCVLFVPLFAAEPIEVLSINVRLVATVTAQPFIS